MPKDKLRKLIIELQAVLNKEGVEAKEWEDYRNDVPWIEQLPHAQWMLGELLLHFEEWEMDKINRWIGFVQCYMSVHTILSIQKLRDLTRECLK